MMDYQEALEKHEKDCRRCREKICKYAIKKFSCLQEIDIKAYEELMSYRRIGTLDEFKILKETHLTGNELVQIFFKLKQLKEYEELGDLEDVRQAVDKQKAKKPYIAEVDSRLFDYDTCRKTVDVFKCPACDSFLSIVNEEEYTQRCPKCGQKLDWSDEE